MKFRNFSRRLKSELKLSVNWPAVLAMLFSTYGIAVHASEPLSEIIVTTELIEQTPLELAGSVSVINARQIELLTAHHLEDVFKLAPNLNYSSGASRGRFIQIRGIGERSEFQEPIINSVGVLVDGIDFTGIATGATALDVKQVEILRGPQGTLFGANALAGLISIVSNAPTNEFSGGVGFSAEEYNGLGWSGYVSGPINDTSGYRLALKYYRSDGYIDNVFLGRDDTNNIEETSARIRYTLNPSDALGLDVSVFYADIDNGYDAFSLDNNRDTYSDEPGQDTQQTLAASMKLQYAINDSVSIEGLISHADSELLYSYDEDWSDETICDDTVCDSDLFGFDWWYSSTDSLQRDNNNTSIDLRVLGGAENSLAWAAGVYHRDQEIDLFRRYTFAAGDFSSNYDTRNTALYSQFDFFWSDQWSATFGIRFEQRDIDYNDSNGDLTTKDEDLWGGKIALEYQTTDGTLLYGLVSRGYKSGGFNLGVDIDPGQREFDTETMLNYELGLKRAYLDGALALQAAVFYQDRDDVQTKQSIVRSIATGIQGGTCPCSFTDLTDNATDGTNMGLEAELNWQVNEQLLLFSAIGLLDTEFGEFDTFQHLNADPENGISYSLKGRDQTHAPGYQISLGGRYQFESRWHVAASVEAKDEFYFSDRHDAQSDAYELLNLELGYKAEGWSIAMYAKNVTDEDVKTRGFGSFGNDPRKFYELEPYNQFAAPRVVGIKTRLDF